MLGDEVRWNHTECSVKTTQGRNRGRENPKKKCNKRKMVKNMADINPTVSINTSNMNGLP